MLFNSTDFVLFFVLVYGGYLLLFRSLYGQNLLLLGGSYLFYGYWDWRFLSLLAISTLVDYFAGIWLQRSKGLKQRKLILILSLSTHLSILGFFKYFNFFADGFARLLGSMGLRMDDVTLNIVLPVGVSFYTFQTMSYTIDIYRGKLAPTRNLLDFALFVAYFPQLVAGPIERAASLLPQIASPRKLSWTQIDAGVYLILWGFFKKIVIADNMAPIANSTFNEYTQYAGLDLLIGVLAFTAQIYGDFSGYSDIARGLSKLMGIELMVNFKLPYFALDPRDFWLRWHISLSSWLRDYLYVPLGGNQKGTLNTYRNLSITMLLGGLWHGADWHFVIWGAYHGLLLIAYRMFSIKSAPGVKRFQFTPLIKMSLMFTFVVIGWILFRAETPHQIMYIFTHLGLGVSTQSLELGSKLLFFVAPLLILELHQHYSGDLLAAIKFKAGLRMLLYAFLVVWIMIFGVRESIEFIYFQF